MSTNESPKPSTSSSPAINTYHCICSQTLLATTFNLSDLPRRQFSGLDHALILPLSSTYNNAPITLKSSASASQAEPGASADADVDADAREDEDEENQEHSSDTQSVFVNTVISPKALMVRREDGFEKRVLYRCGRCRVVMGYVLESVRKIVYLLPGGLIGTKEMLEEKGNTNESQKMIPLMA